MRYQPMLAYPAEPFDSADFIFEIKYDGTRAIAYIPEGKMLNRRDNEIIGRYPEFASLKDSIRAKSAVLDGEVAVFKNGKPDFPSLQVREHASDPLKIGFVSKRFPATYVVFDILELDGKSLVRLPLSERKKILRETLIESGAVVFSEYVEKKGKLFFKKAKELGFEGVMAKRKDSFYEQKRSKAWLKIKALRTLDTVVCGYTVGLHGRERTFGSLILGAYHDGKLVYVGRVGTGFTTEMLGDILGTLKPEETAICPFAEIPSMDKDVAAWLMPEIVAEVDCLLVTKTLKLRAPSFIRLRNDKKPEECVI